MEDEGRYRPTARPYRKRFRYQYRRHVFDKLRAIDLSLREFQASLGNGEVIAEAEVGVLAHKELVLLVQWIRPLHVAIVVDEKSRGRTHRDGERARSIRVDPRLPEEALMRCEVCDNGDRRPARRPYVDERAGRIAVITEIPVEECPACGEVWFAEEVAVRLDELLTEMLATELVAVRPYTEPATSAA